MERFKQGVRRAFVLPLHVSLAVAAGGFGLLIWVFTHDSPPLLDHLAYHLSTYALAVSVTAMLRVVPAVRARLERVGWIRWLLDSPLPFLIRGDREFRALVLMSLSMVWNVVVALVKLLAGRLIHSAWLRSLGTYYLMLAMLRLIVVLPNPLEKKDPASLWRRYRACGIALLLMNAVLLRMVYQIVNQRGGFRYPGPLIYLMAAYAFWAIISATVKLISRRRRADPRMSALQAVSLTSAMVSVLALETAMIARFGDEALFHRRMTAATGGVVCLVELCMALYMVGRGRREIAESARRAGAGKG